MVGANPSDVAEKNKTWTDKHRHVTRKLVEEGLGAEKSVRHWLVR